MDIPHCSVPASLLRIINGWLIIIIFFFLKKKRKRKNEKKLEKLFATFTAKIEQEHPEASRGKWLAVRFFSFRRGCAKTCQHPGTCEGPSDGSPAANKRSPGGPDSVFRDGAKKVERAQEAQIATAGLRSPAG